MLRRKRKLQIAVIDADPGFAEMLGEYACAAFGPETRIHYLQATRAFPSSACSRPDVILLDPAAGNTDETAMQQLSELWRIKDIGRCPVILMTPQLDGNQIREARRFGAADYVEKNNSSLGKVIEKIRPHALRAMGPRRQQVTWLPRFAFSPGALVAILLTVFLGVWMYCNFT